MNYCIQGMWFNNTSYCGFMIMNSIYRGNNLGYAGWWICTAVTT